MTEEDEGDETAVYLYAKTASGTVKQYIPVHRATSFSEIATAVLNGVTVTDGTVELGMVSEKKFTNWEVIQIKGVTALVDATELHANTLSKAKETIKNTTYVNVTGSERTALSRAIRKNITVSEQTAEAYQTAVNALEMAMKAFTDAKASYDAWVDIKGRNFPYASVAKKAAAESAAAVSPTSAADAVSRRETLLPLYRQYAESSAMLEGVNGATDMTSYINNPKAEEGVDGWTTVRGEGSGGSINILDGQPLVEPHLFVEGADGLHLKVVVIGVKVVGGVEQRQALGFHHIMQGELIHDGTVSLEIEDAIVADDFTVAVEELGRSEAVPCIASAFTQMRVGEGDPYLGYLVLTEEMLNLVDAGTQERHVLQSFLVALLQSTPDARAFDVDTYIINVAMGTSQANGIFSLATTKLQDDRVVVVEEIGMPLPLQREALAHDAFIAVFEQVREGLVLSESF
jgi:hypothetical protein